MHIFSQVLLLLTESFFLIKKGEMFLETELSMIIIIIMFSLVFNSPKCNVGWDPSLEKWDFNICKATIWTCNQARG